MLESHNSPWDPPLNLTGMKAVVIGGTSGIGKALALGLARAGADVVASSRSRETVDSTADEIESLGVASLRVCSDVCDRGSLESLRDSVVASFGTIDILVNSAGVTRRIPTLEMDEPTWNEIFNVNLTGTLRACQIFGENMLKQRFGRIINIASSLQLRSVSGGCSLWRQQSCRGFSHSLSRGGVVEPWCNGQRHRSGDIPHASQQKNYR